MFKGSVFVQFADEATQQAFLALDLKPKWKGNELLIKSKKDYVEEKAADLAAGRIRLGEKWENRDNRRGNHHHGKDGNHRKGVDQDDWKKRREDDQKRGFRDDHRGRGRGRGGRGGGGGGRGHDRRGGKSGGPRTRDPQYDPPLIFSNLDNHDSELIHRLDSNSKVPEIAISGSGKAEEKAEQPIASDTAATDTPVTKAESDLPPSTIGKAEDVSPNKSGLSNEDTVVPQEDTVAAAPSSTAPETKESVPMDVDSTSSSKKRVREEMDDFADDKETPNKKVDIKPTDD